MGSSPVKGVSAGSQDKTWARVVFGPGPSGPWAWTHVDSSGPRACAAPGAQGSHTSSKTEPEELPTILTGNASELKKGASTSTYNGLQDETCAAPGARGRRGDQVQGKARFVKRDFLDLMRFFMKFQVDSQQGDAGRTQMKLLGENIVAQLEAIPEATLRNCLLDGQPGFQKDSEAEWDDDKCARFRDIWTNNYDRTFQIKERIVQPKDEEWTSQKTKENFTEHKALKFAFDELLKEDSEFNELFMLDIGTGAGRVPNAWLTNKDEVFGGKIIHALGIEISDSFNDGDKSYVKYYNPGKGESITDALQKKKSWIGQEAVANYLNYRWVLHHIPADILPGVIDATFGETAEKGFLTIREHNAETESIQAYLVAMELFFAEVLHWGEMSNGWFRSAAEWKDLIKKAGYTLVKEVNEPLAENCYAEWTGVFQKKQGAIGRLPSRTGTSLTDIGEELAASINLARERSGQLLRQSSLKRQGSLE